MASFRETKNCLLRPLKSEDFDSFQAIQSDAQVTRFLGGPRTQIQIDQRFNYFLDHQLRFGFSIWRVGHKSENEFIGLAGFIHARMDNSSEELELAYALVPSKWGIGLATELVSDLVLWAKTNLKGKKVIATVNKSNLASRRVLEKSGLEIIETREQDEIWASHHNM